MMLGLAACSGGGRSVQQPLPAPTLMPTVAVSPRPAQPDDTGWLAAGPGVALRRLNVLQDEMLAPVAIVRLDPTRVRLQVGYAPDQPRALSTWHSELDALATTNGGFFDENNRSTALVISNGVVYGSSYQGSGGMLAVDSAGTVTLRYLAEQPYSPEEPLVEAIQSWPMLIKPGGTLAYMGHDTQRARRSVVALDRSGHILFIACAGSNFTLNGLADWLLTTDLDIDAALNLDGGSSTGLYLDSSDQQMRIDAFVPLPIVLMALPG